MSGIIDNIITLQRMRTKALGVLVTNTEKALKGQTADKEKTAEGQAEKLENFVKNVTADVNSVPTRFWFQKERRRLSDEQVRNLADFVSFTQSLTEKVRELLTCFQNSETFEKTNERELQQLQARVAQKLKEFDDALNGTSDTLKKRLSKRVGNVVNGVTKSFRREGFDAANAKRAGKSAAWGLTKVEQT